MTEDLIKSLLLMGQGMLGIFVVMAILSLIVTFMVNFKKIKGKFSKKEQ